MSRSVGNLAPLAKVRDTLPASRTWVIRWRIAGDVWEQRVVWRTASAWSSSPESADPAWTAIRLGLFVIGIRSPDR